MDDGKYIKLENGSLWEVQGADTVNSALWLDMDEITVCNGKLINTDENESVGSKAHQVTGGPAGCPYLTSLK